jgi:quinohemoprotein ethanol dehydrogenase
VWRFYTVPGDPSKPVENPALQAALETWKDAECWKEGCGGTVWDALAYDPKADLLYVGTGNGAPWNREVRSPGGGDNLYLSSILALKPDTGNLVWYYQTTPGDSWDFTATQSLILADISIKGRERKVIMQAPKNGFFYVLDRITGEFLSGQAFTDVNWATGIDPKTGRPIEAPNARYLKEPALIWVAGGGAHSWQPMAYSPDTKLAYIPGTNAPFAFAQDPNYKYQRGRQNFGAAFTRPKDAQNPPGPSGYLVAWDPSTNSERWRVKYPARPGGVLATGGNLVFHGATDGRLIAYTADRGDKVWELTVGGGISTPVSYMIDGKQFVSVLVGRGNGRLLTFVLDGKEPLPPIPAAPAARPR